MQLAPGTPAPTLDASAEALAVEVHEAFVRLVHRHRRLVQRVLARHDLHPAQALCLRVLADRDGTSQRDLADTLMLSAPTVTRMLQRMERSGLVTRGTDPADQRQAVVRLTDTGTGLAALVHAALAEVHERSLARLPAQDLRDLARLLDAWCEVADGDPDLGDPEADDETTKEEDG